MNIFHTGACENQDHCVRGQSWTTDQFPRQLLPLHRNQGLPVRIKRKTVRNVYYDIKIHNWYSTLENQYHVCKVFLFWRLDTPPLQRAGWAVPFLDVKKKPSGYRKTFTFFYKKLSNFFVAIKYFMIKKKIFKKLR